MLRSGNYLQLEELLTFQFEIYAHTRNDKPEETLQEHIQRCHQYLDKIWEDKRMAEQMERFNHCLLPMEHSDAEKQLFYEFFVDCVTFHDVGKINTAFQTSVMKNKTGQKKMDHYLRGSGHSLCSAVLYLDYEYGKLNAAGLKKELHMYFIRILLVNAYCISKHHSDLQELGKFLMEFQKDGAVYDIVKGLYEAQFLEGLYKGPFCKNAQAILGLPRKYELFVTQRSTRELDLFYFVYARFLYSLIVTCDYYATSEFDSQVGMNAFGTIASVEKFIDLFEDNELTKKIRAYEKNDYSKLRETELKMNDLRSEMFLDAERELKKHLNNKIYFLEAPTGCGKSNTALNISLQFLKAGYQKIFYVYPFNTLVQQNVDAMHTSFGDAIDAELGILNSITAIKTDHSEEDSRNYYQEALLNRQFLNYPIILTTHVSFFDTLFGNKKTADFGFLQLQNSVVVLDEIQSYENSIWAEIIIFLKAFANILNMKVVIMSATLPDLELLTGEGHEAVPLILDRKKYFENKVFQKRVVCNYSLLDKSLDLEELCGYIREECKEDKKVLVEFIKKDTAKECFQMFKNSQLPCEVELLTGEDNMAERKRIISHVRDGNTKGMLLIATQVVEAGVDIDMDIGFKDLSKLDSEEQFMGRINRSCKKEGKVYFFRLDQAEKIYKDDIRAVNKKLTLENEGMRDILEQKNFSLYYQQVLEILKKNRNQSTSDLGLESFFEEKVRRMNFPDISKRMELIKPDLWHQTVFLAHEVILDTGEIFQGSQVWNEYKEMLQNNQMDYAEKKVKLSEIRIHLGYFTYQVKKGCVMQWNDQIGEILYLEDGEKYFQNGKLDTTKFQEEVGLFID